MTRYDDLIKDALSKKPATNRAEEIFSGKTLVAKADVPDGRKKQNKLETSYDRYLGALKSAGRIHNYWWDAMSLKIGDNCRYHSDFLVQNLDGTMEIHETKGFMRDDALVKLKVVASMYPFRVMLVKKKSGEWDIKQIEAW